MSRSENIALAVLCLLAFRTLISWWRTEPEARRGLADHVRNGIVVHVAPAEDREWAEILEFPLAAGWDESSILLCVAEIEAL